jgi:3'(2'), 5'-bisphosphate nucleotidase
VENLKQLIPPVIEIAKKASAIILEIYQVSRQFEIKTKADHSPVTQADLLAHELIQAGLQKLTPNIPVLSEEGLEIPLEQRQTWPMFWCVDPLDGTREFIRHSGEFSINIALIENQRPILGLIYIPVLDECYYAWKNGQAYKQVALGAARVIHVRPWPRNQTVIIASHGAKAEKMRQRLSFLGDFEFRPLASAWKFAKIAEGEADLYLRMGDTYEWDTAAGDLILEVAGGKVLDLNLQRLSYNTASLLNPYFIALGDHQELIHQINFADLN